VIETGQKKIGYSELETDLEVNPIISIYKKQIPSHRFFGIPLVHVDLKKRKLEFHQQEEIFQASDVPYSYDISAFQIKTNLHFAFNEETYIFEVYSGQDILAKLGGLGASFFILMLCISSLIIMYYLRKFSKMVRRKQENKMRLIDIKRALRKLQVINHNIESKLQEAEDHDD